MTLLLRHDQLNINQSACIDNSDIMDAYEAEMAVVYQRASRSERDILWMKHRALRQLFDKIELIQSKKRREGK